MPLVLPQALPSSMIDPRQSTTVPKTSKTSDFTEATACAAFCPRNAEDAAPIPADFTNRLLVTTHQYTEAARRGGLPRNRCPALDASGPREELCQAGGLSP